MSPKVITYASLLETCWQDKPVIDTLRFFLDEDQRSFKRDKHYILRPHELNRLKDNIVRALKSAKTIPGGISLIYKTGMIEFKETPEKAKQVAEGAIAHLKQAIAAAA